MQITSCTQRAADVNPNPANNLVYCICEKRFPASEEFRLIKKDRKQN